MSNKESGLLAISQLSNDLRDVLEACDRGDEKASLAVNMFVNRIAQTIASCITDLDGLDALVFTAGIGENSALIRSLVVQKLNCLGLSLNKAANEQGQLFIQNSQSKSKILILPTNEELMIAQDTMRLLDLSTQKSGRMSRSAGITFYTNKKTSLSLCCLDSKRQSNTSAFLLPSNLLLSPSSVSTV